jgi:nucleoporin NUP2
MKPSVSKQIVSFMGHDEQGTPVPFRLRVKTEAAANELKDALDLEVEYVRSKSG